jgi:hypothetical protein
VNDENVSKKGIHIIPAQPGFYIVRLERAISVNEMEILTHAVIGWRIEDDAVEPVTLEGTAQDAFVLGPNGVIESHFEWWDDPKEWALSEARKDPKLDAFVKDPTSWSISQPRHGLMVIVKADAKGDQA